MKHFKILIFIGFCSLSMSLSAQDQNEKEDTGIKNMSTIENKLSFKENLSQNKLEYQLKPISNGRFKLVFINHPTEYVHIKIYDIIGNLILSEENKYSLDSEIEYNFNETNNKIYVVKVESGEENLTKKVNF